jgi:hypothetical protein
MNDDWAVNQWSETGMAGFSRTQGIEIQEDEQICKRMGNG